MLTNGILTVLYYIFAVILYPITSSSDVIVNTNLLSSITSVINYFAFFNGILPMTTIVAALLFIMGIEIGIGTYKLIMWGLSFIPGKS